MGYPVRNPFDDKVFRWYESMGMIYVLLGIELMMAAAGAVVGIVGLLKAY